MDFIREVYKDKPVEQFNTNPKPDAASEAPVARLNQ
jgi:hypothetical protein